MFLFEFYTFILLVSCSEMSLNNNSVSERFHTALGFVKLVG